MPLLSINGKPAHIIDDTNASDFVPDVDGQITTPDGIQFAGCLPPRAGESADPRTVTFEASGLVFYDEKEIAERLEDMWAAQSSIMHRCYHTDALKQSAGTCWVHGTCGAARDLLVMANLPDRIPSPLSVAYHCYSNFGVRGGWPLKGVEAFQEFGASTVELWPENAASKKYDTEETRASRIHQLLEEVVILDSGEAGFWQAMSAICQAKPVGLSYSWWRHYVYGCWGRVESGEVKIGIRNSWGNKGYGDKGYGLLAGRKKFPAWACVFLRMRQSPGPQK